MRGAMVYQAFPPLSLSLPVSLSLSRTTPSPFFGAVRYWVRLVSGTVLHDIAL